MGDIEFNCPQCDQHLAVEATAAGITVACPNCGQAILVPQMAPGSAKPESPKQTQWWLVAAGVTEQVSAFDGLIDEVRIYNRALSADEIKSLATAAHAGADASSAPAQATP
jgi:DNA-directed RNA polymerase subunit RPC12/RpoP